MSLCIVLPNIVLAQDTILFRNWNEVVVKVTEVSDTQIKYNLWSNQSGPVFTKSISDIFMVKYKGGHRDIYDNQQQASKQQANTAHNGKYIISLDGKMEHSRGDMEINGVEIEEDLLKQLLTADEFETFESAHRQRRIGNGLMIPGIIISGCSFPLWLTGSILMAYPSSYSYEQDIYDGYVCFVIGMTLFSLGQTFMAIGIPLKAIGTRRLNWVADSYNQRKFGKDVSLSVAPVMINNPDKTGAHGQAFGAGLTLNF